jgi:hypothetical protein
MSSTTTTQQEPQTSISPESTAASSSSATSAPSRPAFSTRHSSKMAAFQVLDYCAEKLSSNKSQNEKAPAKSTSPTKTVSPRVMFGLSNDV